MKPFEEIVREHGPTVLRVCRAVLGPVDADDAWSETFLSALRAYPRLDPDTNVEAWLVTIAHRKAIDLKRADARRATPVEEVPIAADRRTHADGAWDSAEWGGGGWHGEGWDGDLWEALKALPLKQRQTVAYHYLAGFPHREVASIVGGSEEAARRSAADGIATLRRTYVRTTAGQARKG
ncbi:MAG: RNA polymerase sigma factor [Nocardioidaceae bacterium]